MYMLSKLLVVQQDQFVKQGGIKELMYKARTDFRNNR